MSIVSNSMQYSMLKGSFRCQLEFYMDLQLKKKNKQPNCLQLLR